MNKTNCLYIVFFFDTLKIPAKISAIRLHGHNGRPVFYDPEHFCVVLESFLRKKIRLWETEIIVGTGRT